MTWFDPKIYCKQNLKEKDLKEMEYWESEFRTVLDNAYDRYEEECCPGDSMMLDEIKTQIVDSFVEIVKECLGDRLDDNMVSCIEHYESDVEEIENPKTFFYESGADDNEELPFTEPED